MSIKVACPCGKRFTAKDEFAGRTTKCPGCGQPLVIPQPEAGSDGLQILDGPAPWTTDPNAMFGMPAGAVSAPFMPPAFAQPPAPRKKASSGSKQLLIIGLVVAIGTPCLGMVGCVALVGMKAVGEARKVANRARSGLPPSTIPFSTPTAPTIAPFNNTVDAATQAANDAYIEEYIKLLEDYAGAASQIRDLASAETHGPRVDELAEQINRRQIEVQFKLIALPPSEDQRTTQKYGARLKAAQARVKQEDDRLLQLSSQLQVEALRSRIDSISPPAPSLPPSPTPPFGPP